MYEDMMGSEFCGGGIDRQKLLRLGRDAGTNAVNEESDYSINNYSVDDDGDGWIGKYDEESLVNDICLCARAEGHKRLVDNAKGWVHVAFWKPLSEEVTLSSRYGSLAEGELPLTRSELEECGDRDAMAAIFQILVDKAKRAKKTSLVEALESVRNDVIRFDGSYTYFWIGVLEGMCAAME